MRFTTDRLKGFFAGILLTTATWIIVTNLQDTIFKYSPVQNRYFIAIVLVIIAWYLGAKR